MGVSAPPGRHVPTPAGNEECVSNCRKRPGVEWTGSLPSRQVGPRHLLGQRRPTVREAGPTVLQTRNQSGVSTGSEVGGGCPLRKIGSSYYRLKCRSTILENSIKSSLSCQGGLGDQVSRRRSLSKGQGHCMFIEFDVLSLVRPSSLSFRETSPDMPSTGRPLKGVGVRVESR